jgi:hypothetical protein
MLPTVAGRVFISHASEDREIAQAVCEAIESRGVACWIAPRDITPGKDYAQALYDAIGECTSLVLVFSEHSNRSPQVRREVERAARDGDPIIPFRIDDTVPAGGLLFNVGTLDWLAPSSVDLPTQVGILADIVQARMEGGDDAERPIPSAEKIWLGSPAVVRRVTATWMTVLLWVSLVMAVFDLGANLDAFANAVYTQSLFAEADVAERVLALAALQLILLVPSAFVWLIWLMTSFLTLEAAGMEGLRFGARRVPGRFMWPGLRYEGGSSVVAVLWQASRRLGPASAPESKAAASAPRWLVLLWLLPVVLVPLSIFTASAGDADEWDDERIVAMAMVTDVLWIAAGVVCLYTCKVLEKRMRRREADLVAGTRRGRSAQTTSV